MPPENWPVITLFAEVMTQWRMGSAGPIGLDYAVVERQAELIGLRRREMRAAWPLLKTMEIEALAWFSEQRSKD